MAELEIGSFCTASCTLWGRMVTIIRFPHRGGLMNEGEQADPDRFQMIQFSDISMEH